MESRKAKISSCAAGGTAGKGSKTYKLTIPSAWINKLGLNEDAREVTMSFDGDSITITPVQTPDQFVKRRLSLGHNVVSIKYFDKKKLCSQIYADKTPEELIVENHTDLFTKTAFGKKEDPSWSDLEFFIEERCIPRQRAGLRYYLEALDLSEYDPWSIISKTKGKMAEDDQWMEVETLS